MKGVSKLSIGILLSFAIVVALWARTQQHSAAKPTRRWDLRWIKRHREITKKASRGPYDLVFLGDSITQNWETFGQPTWERYYGDRNALNLGISGDQTQHVLWRLGQINLEAVNPKLVVLLVGTNNSADNSAGEIAEGILQIVATLNKALPEAKILLMAIFPRGEVIDDPRRRINEGVNQIIKDFADNEVVFHADIGSKWLNSDGSTNLALMPDALHPNEAGYAVWAEAVEPMVSELIGESGDTAKHSQE